MFSWQQSGEGCRSVTDYIRLIQVKRDGGEHTRGEIRSLVKGYLRGEVADYQMSAWLMAVVLKGLSYEETLALADAEVESGSQIDLSSLGRPVIDKHSTGGVGDKVTLVLAPLVAACGAVFGKMSGRSLGHTGGTIDKLESIPGFVTDLDAGRFKKQLETIGICVAGQSKDMVPADKKLYALRDVTATVESNPLVAASIMSKKIATGTAAVVMDIKIGRGAFFKNRGQAAGVFHLIKKIGEARGVEVRGVISPMDQPLGRTVGNSLEVLEAVETLRGNGPDDLVAVVSRLALLALEASDAGLTGRDAQQLIKRCLADGTALDRFREWIEAQGGDAAFVDDPAALPAAAHVLPVRASQGGFVTAIDALEVGLAVQALGAGRRQKEVEIDHTVGLILDAKTGDRVAPGDSLARVYANDSDKGEQAALRVNDAFKLKPAQMRSEWSISDL